jgi:hypothetical protein
VAAYAKALGEMTGTPVDEVRAHLLALIFFFNVVVVVVVVAVINNFDVVAFGRDGWCDWTRRSPSGRR